MESTPGSSELEEHPTVNREVPRSTRGQGSTFLYVVVRQELTGGALLAHVGHAAREAAGPRPTEDERICVLSATKAQLEQLCADLAGAGVPFKACVETDGPMAGSTPSVGLAVTDRDALKPLLGHLKVWRAPK